MADYTLKELVDFLDRGLITREEFDQQKQALLSGGTGSSDPTAKPSHIGPYIIGDLIGEGGMGRVFTARHRTAEFAARQGGDVALKVLHAHYSRRPDVMQRFEREAALGIQLEHPGIVRVHELVVDGGQVALAMEKVEGCTLSEIIGQETGPIPWERAWPMFRQLLDAVGYAHSKKVVHRDIKPENVIVGPDGTLKVLDFGIAKEMEGGGTQTSVGMGTPDYMAPEQWEDAKRVDARADVYALGMTLYEMLAGRLPWKTGASLPEVLKAKVGGELPPPTDFYPDIPEPIVAVVQQALVVDRDQRLGSVKAMAAALERASVASEEATTKAEEDAGRRTEAAADAKACLRQGGRVQSPYHQELIDTVDVIVSAYDGSIVPPALEELKAIIDAGEFERAREEITHLWNGLLKHHQRTGSRLQHKVTGTFNTLNFLLRKFNNPFDEALAKAVVSEEAARKNEGASDGPGVGRPGEPTGSIGYVLALATAVAGVVLIVVFLYSSSPKFKSVSAGFLASCGVTNTGGVECWGRGERSNPPTGTFESVSVGTEHTCGVKLGGSVECWGRDDKGESTPPNMTFRNVSASGYEHSCGVTGSGSVECWGLNNLGQSSPPTGRFKSVSAGDVHTCGVMTSGRIKCWGWDDYNQATPPSGTFKSVSAGRLHTCGVTSIGSVECWGINDGSTEDDGQVSDTPMGDFESVSAGKHHTCGVNSAGSLECWGRNDSGEATPPSGSFDSVSAGTSHTCGVNNDSWNVECWGHNGSGEASPP